MLCRGPVNLSPWLYCIPSDLAPFHDLLAQLGVRESFSAEQYCDIMSDMAAALKGKRLPAEQQEQAIAVLQVTRASFISPSMPLGILSSPEIIVVNLNRQQRQI